MTTAATVDRPDWSKPVQKGDWLTIKPEFSFTRGGQSGLVIDEPDNEGVNLDFFRCYCGEEKCPCYTSIERWQWPEIEATP